MPSELVYATDDPDGWSAALPARESVFGSVEFARVVEQHLGYRAQLYVLQDGSSRIAYPLFLRPVRSLPLGAELSDGLSDTLSPEFTGPLARGAPAHALAGELPARFSAFAASQGVVAEFAHLHPWKTLSA